MSGSERVSTPYLAVGAMALVAVSVFARHFEEDVVTDQVGRKGRSSYGWFFCSVCRLRSIGKLVFVIENKRKKRE